MSESKLNTEVRRPSGTSKADRAMWNRLYSGSPLRDLPWFAQEPYPPLVRAVESGRLKPPGPILDIGCGLGTNALWLASRGFRATGIDLAPTAVEAAKSRRTSESRLADFRVDDILRSELPAGRFRAAVDVGCFHTLRKRHRRAYSQGVARLLRPGATLVLFWVAREETGTWGPPHRLSVGDITESFESEFRVERIEYRPRTGRLTRQVQRERRPLTVLAGYTAELVRRDGLQPAARG